MKKSLWWIGLALLAAILAVSCTAKEAAGTPAVRAVGSSTSKMAVVLGYNGAIDDRSFSQGAWQGMQKFAKDNNLPDPVYYKAAADSTSSQVDTIELAIQGGAEIMVMPGFPWGNAVYIAQDRFPDAKLVVLDDEPHTPDYSTFKIGPNTHAVYYAEHESGFLAGYAAVKEGLRNMGFLGGQAVPAVVRFGYGFIYGADVAAQELGLAPGSVTIKYHYVGNFDPSPENQTFAASWFGSGTEAIFSAAGQVGNVVMAAAEQAGPNKIVIGVDVDQAGESPTVITSAMKNLGGSTYQVLEQWKNGAFPGGTKVTLTAREDGVGLPTDDASWRFKKFTKAEYQALYDKIHTNADGIVDKIPTDSGYDDASKIPTKVVKVSVI